MSDFFSNGWSLFVAIGTLLSLAFCLVLLFGASKRKLIPGDETTGHVWDEDLRELNNPLPRWWMLLFVVTVIFSLGYLLFYPGLGSSAGQLAWSSAGAHAEDLQAARAAAASVYARFEGMAPETLAADPQARAIGERLFVNHCATCHGSDARGSKGFPNLADRDWLWGGTPERIAETIRDGRQGVMPPMAAAVGSAQGVRQLAHYVLSLSGSPHDNIAAQLGREKFAVCAACHGAKGQGNTLMGAPNLSDRIWLHGWGEPAIVKTINEGRSNVMPAHKERLAEEQIRVLAAYVWGLSQPPAKPAADGRPVDVGTTAPAISSR